ncbi:MAG: pyruvate dehydrogenase (acetyl-transferring), homodimeric type, partial [Actinobacteria bacterium]|nr:pyruvate dehydrogenase (acetyl-transferring), homodimeric type [Actinomycetota bacterium]
GLYKWSEHKPAKHQATVLFSGSAHSAARAAADELLAHFDVSVELWSATSYKTLREEAIEVERWNRLHPTETPRIPRVTQLLSGSNDPIIAVTDFVRAVPEQINRFVGNRTFTPLGTDGMGRSDTREALRSHFEVDMPHIVIAVLHDLAQAGSISKSVVTEAIARYGVATETLGALYA